MRAKTDYLEQLRMHHDAWNRKACLRNEYGRFHRLIQGHLAPQDLGEILEIGSGIGALSSTIPMCQPSDLRVTPWVDRVENVYDLSCADASVSNMILFDVFHHLEHPGSAMLEIHRALNIGGRLHIFEPYISLLGRMVYGCIHEEPMGLREPIKWLRPVEPESSIEPKFYAAQGNATRVFFWDTQWMSDANWRFVMRKRLSALAYLGTGGFSKPSLCPRCLLPFFHGAENMLDWLPDLFATRCYIVVEKTGNLPVSHNNVKPCTRKKN